MSSYEIDDVETFEFDGNSLTVRLANFWDIEEVIASMISQWIDHAVACRLHHNKPDRSDVVKVEALKADAMSDLGRDIADMLNGCDLETQVAARLNALLGERG